MRAACLALAALAAFLLVPGVRAAPGWRTQAESVPVRYTIQADLRPAAGGEAPRRIVGTARILWTNTASTTADCLYLHLYPNAFRNSRSSLVRELLRNGDALPDDMVWGGIEIQRMTLLGRALEWTYVQPDDGNADDRTVARVALAEPVEPSSTIALVIEFTTELPSILRRMGASRDYVFAAQWYPKLGRFLGTDARVPHLREGWTCHQYHVSTEFDADFADYDVTLVVPNGWKTGATGALVAQPVENPALETRTETWQARSVVDFAWTASPRFLAFARTVTPSSAADPADPVVTEQRRVRRLLDAAPEDTELPPVRVTLLLQPEHADQEERHFEAVRVALGTYGAWFGPYPYPQLTVVDPAFGGERSGGMEYPQLVTAGTSVGSPASSLRPEHVVVHEVGHQWFMNLLANNEAQEAWLDEGLNSWATAKAMHLRWGPATSVTTVLGHPFETELAYTFPGLHAGWPGAVGLPKWAHPPDLEAFRLWRDLPLLGATGARRHRDDPFLPARRSYLRNAPWDEMVRAGWEYVDAGSYRANAYPRPILFLETIARTLRLDHGAEEGERRFLRALREYARTHRFRHPRGEDLLAAFREHAAFDPAPRWNALARSTGLVDYAVESVSETTDPALEGWTDAGGVRRLVQRGSDDAERRLRSSVLVRRRGEVAVPVTVRVRIAGAERPVEVRWDGAERWRRFPFDGRVVEAAVDPDRVFLQDARLSDNAWRKDASPQPAVKWSVQTLLWLENALTAWGRFF